VVCPRGRVSPVPPRMKGAVEILTGARSGMNRSPMTRISLEVILGGGQLVSLLHCCCTRFLIKLAMEKSDVKASESEAWHSSYAERME
jgi:hypothetical protein